MEALTRKRKLDRLFKRCNDCKKWLLGVGIKEKGYRSSRMNEVVWYHCPSCDQKYDND